MKRTEISFDSGTVPASIRDHLAGATVYDSSCSETARTLYIEGPVRAFLKIGGKGSLERECRMSEFLHRRSAAPQVIAYASDSEADRDFLLTEALRGEDGTDGFHLGEPRRLAAVFGESLRMLHSFPAEGCPYPGRTAELRKSILDAAPKAKLPDESLYAARDEVVIHGDYCLPNIVMDRFSFAGFIDLGHGGVGDRHCDLYWGLWTLRYNLKTDGHRDSFLDGYGRHDVDPEGLAYFTRLAELEG